MYSLDINAYCGVDLEPWVNQSARFNFGTFGGVEGSFTGVFLVGVVVRFVGLLLTPKCSKCSSSCLFRSSIGFFWLL